MFFFYLKDWMITVLDWILFFLAGKIRGSRFWIEYCFFLQERLEDHGFGLSKQTELMGRAATELCLQLLGGQHRLAVNNTHQLPLAVFLCGTSRPAVFGLTAARHLAGHGVRTQVYLPETGTQSGILEQELRLYRLTGTHVNSNKVNATTSAILLNGWALIIQILSRYHYTKSKNY